MGVQQGRSTGSSTQTFSWEFNTDVQLGVQHGRSARSSTWTFNWEFNMHAQLGVQHGRHTGSSTWEFKLRSQTGSGASRRSYLPSAPSRPILRDVDLHHFTHRSTWTSYWEFNLGVQTESSSSIVKVKKKTEPI